MKLILFVKFIFIGLFVISFCQAGEKPYVQDGNAIVALNWGNDKVVIEKTIEGDEVLFVLRPHQDGSYTHIFEYIGGGEIVAIVNGWGDETAPFVAVWMTATGYRLTAFIKQQQKIMCAIEDGSEVPPEIESIWHNGIRTGDKFVIPYFGWVFDEDGKRVKRPLGARVYEWSNSTFHKRDMKTIKEELKGAGGIKEEKLATDPN